jgi:Fe(3+) dicitrate transport protein
MKTLVLARHLAVTSAVGLSLCNGVPAQEMPKVLETMVVSAETEFAEAQQPGWLSDVVGAAIFAGKKTAVIDLKARAWNVGNNYRQALSQTSSLLLSEESSPLVSIGYRGLNPHRAQFTQMLRDGIPIHADQFGYPEAYYTPPLDIVDRIEFLHGGAALQHGPQPGGALNYITRRPRTDKPFSLRTQHVGGSDGLYSNFSSAEGSVNRLGYHLYFNRRESGGFRSANSDYDLNDGAIKLLYSLDDGGKIIFNIDSYQESHGEPGGLSVADFKSSSLKATRLQDRFSLDRNSVSLTHETEPSADRFFTTSAWWVDYTRSSYRQDGGGFGVSPAAGKPFKTERQSFDTLGIDSRYRMNWSLDAQHTLTTGMQVYQVASPRTDTISNSTTVKRSEREVSYLPVFAENKFSFGKCSITPGLRLENVWQTIERPGTGAMDDDERHILLGGLGVEYATAPQSAIYGNLSQSYRPKTYSEAVPSEALGDVPDDLEEGKALEFEIGYRTHPGDWLTLDASAFRLSFKDQIGKVGTTTANVGDSIHKGIDFSARIDLLESVAWTKPNSTLDWSVNATLLDAEFTRGPADGNTPQYAPDYIFRTGFTYNHEGKIKVTLGGTFLGDHFANDSNVAPYTVPAYRVWDLTAEYNIHENLRLILGINNLFDATYYARVRSDGIDPANGRNCYVGASITF